MYLWDQGVLSSLSLMLGACAQKIIIVVCVCVCVCSQSASSIGHFYSKLNMAIRFSEGIKGLQLTDLSKVVYFKRYYFVPTFGVQVSHFVHMAIIVALVWCMAALQGKEFHIIGRTC